MKLQALGDNVIIRKLPEGNKTESGIVLLGDGILRTHPEAIVTSSNGCVKEGDKIKYTRGAILDIELENNKTITLVKEQDILSVL